MNLTMDAVSAVTLISVVVVSFIALVYIVVMNFREHRLPADKAIAADGRVYSQWHNEAVHNSQANEYHFHHAQAVKLADTSESWFVNRQLRDELLADPSITGNHHHADLWHAGDAINAWENEGGANCDGGIW